MGNVLFDPQSRLWPISLRQRTALRTILEGTPTMSNSADISEARRRIEAAYDPELLRVAGRRLADELADHLAKAEASDGVVLPWREPAENVQEASQSLDAAVGSDAGRDALAARFAELLQTMLDRGHNLHDPRYIGHQVAASVPIAGLFDAVGSVTNQVMATYDMGPWATSAERAMIERLGEQIGWHRGDFSGIVTNGGSLANLTALLVARNVTLGDSWERGTATAKSANQADSPPVLVVHSDTHYSVARSAGILGLGTSHVIRVGLDSRRRMDVQQLDDTLRGLREKGQPVVAVVACACSTSIGAFDPLNDIADVCRQYGVWLHVDAAHGGAACLSDKHRHLVAGLDRADSVVWDAHKMMFMPGLCAFAFYRNRPHKFEAFRQDAPYLFDPAAPGLAEYDSAMGTVECTKRAAAFALWGTWSLFGPQLFADLVETTFSMGRVLYDRLSAASDFVALHEPQCNIVVFRHIPPELRDAPPERLGRFQLELRRRIIESGEFYIVSTRLDGVGALRVTIINPLTAPEHLDRLLDAIREAGRRILENTSNPK
jgi:L-2,4-diaminobutyrate decarboxylase